MSNAWVEAGGRRRATEVIDAASGLVTWIVVPYAAEPGAPEITGRFPWKRYGGE
jgi:hypothetical protein